MSFPLNDTFEKSPLQESLTDASWKEEIVPLLPKDLEEAAWRLGAMTRKGGKIQSASDLLRGILVYAMCVTSFKLLGAWGVLSGVADLADTSWRERVRKSGTWLCWVLNELMRPEKQQPCPQLKKAGYGPIELVDASHLKCVGPKGKVIRFHSVYTLLTQQLHQVVVSTTKVAESIANFCIQARAIYVHDSGYGYRGQVAQTAEAGAYTVTSFYPGTFPLENEQGEVFDLVKWLKKQRARAGFIKSVQAFFWEKGKKYEVRVIGLRRTEEQVKRALRQKKVKAKKDKRNLQNETIYLTNWVLLLTTLPARDWSAQEVLSLYRARWHIEMLFKRIKQLLDQHILRAETEETAKVTVLAILVSWVLQQDVAREMQMVLNELYSELEKQQEEEEAEAGEKEEPALSEWRLQTISVDIFYQQVHGGYTRQRVRECLPQLQRHVRERPRTRSHQWQRAAHRLIDSPKSGHSPGGSASGTTAFNRITALA
jgi:Transposase DDE domain